jgi:hypothetical protein
MLADVVNDKEYMKTQMSALEEQDMHNTDKYTMSAPEFFKKMEKENPSAKSVHQLTQLKTVASANVTSNATANITANVTANATANVTIQSNSSANSTSIANVAVVLSPAYSLVDTKLSLEEDKQIKIAQILKSNNSQEDKDTMINLVND